MSTKPLSWLLLLGLCLGCERPNTEAPLSKVVPSSALQDYQSAFYQKLDSWLCHPEKTNDPCHQDLSATELLPDGTKRLVSHTPADSPKVDCFYIYPTVDMHLKAGNHTDFNDTSNMEEAALAQITLFTEACTVYAPLYRQVTIGTYSDREGNKAYFDVAYSDVLDAFQYYLSHYNKGRKMVVLGHSQGAQMVTRLLQDTFDKDEALRSRLVVAMPIGFYVDAPKGSIIGGSFSHIPLCSKEDELACVITYRSQPQGVPPNPKYWPVEAGKESLCISPSGEGKPFSRTYLLTDRLRKKK